MENEFENNPINMPMQSNLLVKTFAWMFLGLFTTAILAWTVYSSGFYLDIILNDLFMPLLAIEFIVVLLFSFLINKLSPFAAGLLFFIYAAINGVTFSVIFAVYEIISIALAFLGAAGLFAGLAIYGYTTKRDLSNFGTIAIFTVLAGIIVSLINLLIGNSILDIIINWALLIAFAVITAYDMQKIKSGVISGKTEDAAAIHGALHLYLDFINMFLKILRLFGRRR